MLAEQFTTTGAFSISKSFLVPVWQLPHLFKKVSYPRKNLVPCEPRKGLMLIG